jgi:hypothetical protein
LLDGLKAKLVLQLVRGSDSRRGQSTSNEVDVDLLVQVDLLEVGIEGVGVSGLSKIMPGELGECLLVELSFQILQSEGIIEDNAIIDDRRGHPVAWFTLVHGRGHAKRTQKGGD